MVAEEVATWECHSSILILPLGLFLRWRRNACRGDRRGAHPACRDGRRSAGRAIQVLLYLSAVVDLFALVCSILATGVGTVVGERRLPLFVGGYDGVAIRPLMVID